MLEAERQSYTVTPGPEVLAKMGTSWTLFTMPPVMFAVGPNGEPPEPATVTMTAEQAADLAESGYAVQALAGVWPEPVNDVQVSPGLEGVEPEPVDGVVPEPALMQPGEANQIEPGTQVDGSPAEQIRHRKA